MHADAFVRPSSPSNLFPALPPALLQLSGAAHTLTIRSSRTHHKALATPNCRSNPIAHRVRRKRQRLPPSLLIENASDQHRSNSTCLPEAFPIKASDHPTECRMGICSHLGRGENEIFQMFFVIRAGQCAGGLILAIEIKKRIDGEAQPDFSLEIRSGAQDRRNEGRCE
jgi:hypothetical protein